MKIVDTNCSKKMVSRVKAVRAKEGEQRKEVAVGNKTRQKGKELD